jgi:CubicO group peptidase (beta-lactamase class C family)
MGLLSNNDMKLHRRTFIKRLGFGATGLGLLSSFPGCVTPQGMVHGRLPRSTPEAQGVSSAAILGFLEAVAESKHEFHSFMMVRRGHVIAEGWWTPYRAGANHMLYSLSKSFTSTAAGFAVAEGKLHVDDLVTSFFPDDLPQTVEPHLAELRVKHLLTMSVGHATDSTPIITKEENWVKSFLSLPIEHEPGNVFLYNSGATYMVSAIVQKVSGQKVIDYLRPRLFEPLDIRGMTWEISPRGINTGGWGLAVRTEALAKFGQFYLQNGAWNGRQILPAAWIREATTFKIQQPAGKGADLEKLKETSDWHQGYCYQFWRCRHNAFRGDGAFGQFMVVMPDQEAVVAITSQTSDLQNELNLVWDHLLPAIKDSPLPADLEAHDRLAQKLASLALPLAQGRTHSPTANRITGKTFRIEPNEAGVQSVSFDMPALRALSGPDIFLNLRRGPVYFSPQQASCTFYLTDAGGRYAVECGLGKWVDGECNVPGTPPKITVGNLRLCKIAASAAWKDENTLVMLWRYYETPHHDTVTCHFEGDNVKVEFMNGIPGHAETRPVLRGRT